MESRKIDGVNTYSNDVVKQLKFHNLPDGSSKWIVLACGKVVNERNGGYLQQIIFRKYSDGDNPVITWNLNTLNNLAFVDFNLGSIRLFAPGTIVQGKRIVQFAHEYLTKIDIEILKPQELEKQPFRIIYDQLLPGYERLYPLNSIDLIETRVFNSSRHKQVIIPCNVIADYYYYGKNTYLTKAIFEGSLDSRFSSRNEVYNPRKLKGDVSPKGKIIVTVELQRRMDMRDKFKIARLAHDSFFHDKCMDVYGSILRGTTEASYIDTDLPINQPTVLSVYGVKLRGVFLVHSISKCTAKPPFDLVIATKRFRGKLDFDDLPFGEGGNAGDGMGLAPKPTAKPRTRRRLKEPDEKIVGENKPQWDAISEDIEFDNGQTDNFPDNAAINEKDLYDPEKQKESIETLIEYGFAPRLSTNPNRTGSDFTLPLNFSVSGPIKPRPAQPTKSFEIIENIVSFVFTSIKGQGHETTSQVLCPVIEGVDKYSAFPVLELLKETDDTKRKKYLFYCYQYIQQKGHTQHRRIFINELMIEGDFFYIMDIEPKYKVHNSETKVERFVSSSGVIFYCGKSSISHNSLIDILKKVVTTYQTKDGRWEFLKPKFPFERIRHYTAQSSYESILKFISKHLK